MSNDPRAKGAEHVHPNAKAAEAAGKRRADYVRALKEELDGVERVGKEERAEAIKAELERVSKIKDRVKAPAQVKA